MSSISKAQNIDDIDVMARRALPKGLYDYINRGAEDEVTMRENAAAIKRLFIRHRVGIDVSKVDMSTSLFGVRQTLPIGFGVTALSAMMSYQGELRIARAAAAAGIPYMVGTSNFSALSAVKPILGDLLWRQIYPYPSRDMFNYHVDQAREHGVNVIVVTMDSPTIGNREYMRRGGFSPMGMSAKAIWEMLCAPRWLRDTLLPYLLSGGLPDIDHMPEGERKFYKGSGSFGGLTPDFTWDDIRDLRKRWKGILVLKGLATAEDAKIAATCGVDGIIVSNHGGRCLDGSVPSISALREIVDAVAPKVTVMVDGGFRRGADIMKAIAIGASAVFIGRATLFGLVAGGEPGVTRVIDIYRDEIRRAMQLAGWQTLSDPQRSDLSRGD